MDRKEKIKRAQKGDDRCFHELITEQKALLYKTAYLYVKNEQDALDVVGETVFKAYKSIKTLKQPEYFTTWLVKIVINQSLTMIRKRKEIVPLFEEKDIVQAAKGISPEEKIDLLEAVSKLNENYKSVVILKYMHDMTLDQISDVLETPIGTVKTRLYRALNELRTYMTQEGRLHYES